MDLAFPLYGHRLAAVPRRSTGNHLVVLILDHGPHFEYPCNRPTREWSIFGATPTSIKSLNLFQIVTPINTHDPTEINNKYTGYKLNILNFLINGMTLQISKVRFIVLLIKPSSVIIIIFCGLFSCRMDSLPVNLRLISQHQSSQC